MEPTWDLRSLASWRGKQMIAADGAKIGKINAIVYDYVTREPVWLEVLGPPLGIRPLLVPVRGAVADDGRLRVAHTEAKIKNQPALDFGEGFDSLTGEHNLYDYFDLPFDENSDFRVLRVSDHLPGLEQVTTEVRIQ